MFKKSKLAAILEDEGLIKTAGPLSGKLKKGEMYLLQARSTYYPWNFRKGPKGGWTVYWNGEEGKWEPMGGEYNSATRRGAPIGGRSEGSGLNLAVEFISGWSPAIEKMVMKRYVGYSAKFSDVPSSARDADAIKLVKKMWLESNCGVFRIVGKWKKGPPVGPYTPTKGPYILLIDANGLRPLPQDDDVMPRLDDPNIDDMMLNREVIIPRGSYIKRLGTAGGKLQQSADEFGFEITKDIVAIVDHDGLYAPFEAVIPFSTQKFAPPKMLGTPGWGGLTKRDTDKGRYDVWPPGHPGTRGR